MATMKEIAELAGVSRGTVDRVLNHRGEVNPITEKKILDIVQLLDYQPNKAGIALATQKRKLKIGVLLFGSENPFFDEVMIGLNKKLEELSFYGCTTIEKRTTFDLKEQLNAIEDFLEQGIHGFIISPYYDSLIQEKIDQLYEMGIPCVTVNTDIPESKRIAYVGSDYYKSGQTAGGLMSLFTNGKANIGIITGSHNILCHKERIDGFKNVLNSNYPNMNIIEIIENEDNDYKSYDIVTNMLSSHPDITALYFTAAGVYGGCQAISKMKLKSPLIVISYDTVKTTVEMLKSDIITATLCQQPLEQGANSISILIEYLVHVQLPKKELNYVDVSIKIKENL